MTDARPPARLDIPTLSSPLAAPPDGQPAEPGPGDFATVMGRHLKRAAQPRSQVLTLVVVPLVLLAVGASVRALAGPVWAAIVAAAVWAPYAFSVLWVTHLWRRKSRQAAPAVHGPDPADDPDGAHGPRIAGIDWSTAEDYTSAALAEIEADSPLVAARIRDALDTMRIRTGSTAAYLYVIGCPDGHGKQCRQCWGMRINAAATTMLGYPVLTVGDVLLATAANTDAAQDARDAGTDGLEMLDFVLTHELHHAHRSWSRAQRLRGIMLASGWLPLGLLVAPALLTFLAPAVWALLNLSAQAEELLCDRAALREAPSGGPGYYRLVRAELAALQPKTRRPALIMFLLVPNHPPIRLRARLAAQAAARADARYAALTQGM